MSEENPIKIDCTVRDKLLLPKVVGAYLRGKKITWVSETQWTIQRCNRPGSQPFRAISATITLHDTMILAHDVDDSRDLLQHPILLFQPCKFNHEQATPSSQS